MKYRLFSSQTEAVLFTRSRGFCWWVYTSAVILTLHISNI